MGGGVRGLSDRTFMIPFGLMWGLADRPHTPSVGTKVKEYLGSIFTMKKTMCVLLAILLAVSLGVTAV